MTEPGAAASRSAPDCSSSSEGQTHHAAGPTDGGFLVSALWDTKEHADAFGAHIGSVMPIEGGFQGAPEERTATVVNEQAA